MVFSRLAALSLKASAIVTDQFPLDTTPDGNLQSFDWANITPHTSFVWHGCFGDFKCARLQVPMDWHRNTTEADRTVALAVIKLEATVSITDPTYGGPVFFNPGGPGGSGVQQILRRGHAFRTILSAGSDDDSSTAKNFDVISFDPRGVNNTTPFLACFPNRLELATWLIEKDAQGYIGDTNTSFDNLWARVRAVAAGCSKRSAGEGLGKHMSTAPVARDVLELFERHGEWRAAEAQRLLKNNPSLSHHDRAAITRRSAYTQGEELIQYWGFSYGSVLGAHIAAMFPDRIARLVIDGVVDSHDYMAAAWMTNLRDTDMAFTKLAEYCWIGGKRHCPIWHADGRAAIIDRILAVLDNFQQNPIGTPGNATHRATMVNYHDYQTLVREGVYNLMIYMPMFAQVIYELEGGTAPTLEAWKMEQLPPVGEPLSETCLKDGPYSSACHKGSEAFLFDATYGIACSDGLSRTKQTKEEFKEYADMLIQQSSLVGASWAEIMLPCTAWHLRPAWRYEGDFVAKTAHPLLLIGNTFDPVTPLRNAFTMAKAFEDSRVLQQDSGGHCSYASPSMCTGKALRRYFQTGELPALVSEKDYAFCKPDLLPLQGYVKGSRPGLPEGESDTALWESLVHINQTPL